ncbi:MAG: radical SAM protein [Anaerolineae bacterium]|nr:radical SAM protein [Anaerolineae bacterium]
MSDRVESVQVSIGTAGVLGLASVTMDAAPTTAYLLLGGRCLMNCAFCTQARSSQASAERLSRVTWPSFRLDQVTVSLAEAVECGALRRACLQVTFGDDAFRQALVVLRAVRAVCDVPFDVAILPRDLHEVRTLVKGGADHVGFGLDAACERVFRDTKSGNWHRSLALIEAVARDMPGHAALHLIVGLGETEAEMVERVQWAHDRGVTVGLFAFTPVRGTHLESRQPPPLSTYRRMQMARWLVTHDLARVEEMTFDPGGRLISLGAELPAGGEAFRTSGCPDCNRPFYNEQPGGTMYNYPRPLTGQEAERAVQEMELESRC